MWQRYDPTVDDDLLSYQRLMDRLRWEREDPKFAKLLYSSEQLGTDPFGVGVGSAGETLDTIRDQMASPQRQIWYSPGQIPDKDKGNVVLNGWDSRELGPGYNPYPDIDPNQLDANTINNRLGGFADNTPKTGPNAPSRRNPYWTNAQVEAYRKKFFPYQPGQDQRQTIFEYPGAVSSKLGVPSAPLDPAPTIPNSYRPGSTSGNLLYQLIQRLFEQMGGAA